MRLGLYIDLVYRLEGGVVYTDQPVVHFATTFASKEADIVLFGRLDPSGGRAPYRVSGPHVEVIPLPHYPSLAALGRLGAALGRSVRSFADELERLDAVWLFGPHPLSILFALIARRRKVPVFLGVRQDFPVYVRHRLPSRRWLWAIPVARVLETAWRLLSRRMPTIVVGDELAKHYGSAKTPALATGFSLLRSGDIVASQTAESRSWDGELTVLNVGRLDPEKNPTLLPEILARLRERDGRWRLIVIGDGPMRGEVERRAAELGVSDALELRGYVPNGPELWREYRASNAFLHVSLTEGLPQVLWEAQGAGLPVVATDVGGIGAALGHGAGGLLVPARDADAAAAALERLSGDPELRTQLVTAGLRNASRETLDAHLDRIVEYMSARGADFSASFGGTARTARG